MKAIRKKYNALRKEQKRKFQKHKTTTYKQQSSKLKGRKHKIARDKLKSTLAKRLKVLHGKMPSSAKKSFEELEQLINVIKELKW